MAAILTLLALAGPHLFPWIARRAQQIHLDPAVATAILGGLWAAVTGAGVIAGRSNRTADGGGSGWLEKVGRVAPIVFVLGYLLILATLLQSSIPIVALSREGGGWTRAVLSLRAGRARARKHGGRGRDLTLERLQRGGHARSAADARLRGLAVR